MTHEDRFTLALIVVAMALLVICFELADITVALKMIAGI